MPEDVAVTMPDQREKFVTHRYLNGVVVALGGTMVTLTIFLAGFVVARIESHQSAMIAIVSQYGADIDGELLVFQNRIAENQARALSTAESTHLTAIAGLAARIDGATQNLSREIGRIDARQLRIFQDLTSISRGQISAEMRQEIAEAIIREAIDTIVPESRQRRSAGIVAEPRTNPVE